MKDLGKSISFLLIAVLAAVAVYYGTRAYYNWRASTKLNARLDQLRQAGEPVSLEQLATESVPEDQNAAAILQKAHEEMEAIHKQLAPLFQSQQNNEYVQDSRLTDKAIGLIRDTLAAHPEAIRSIKKAANAPSYVTLLDFTQPPSTVINELAERAAKLRQGPRILALEVDVLLEEGRRDEAVQTSLDILRLGRHFEREPFTNGYLTALATRSLGLASLQRTLSEGPVSEQTRAELDAELARQDDAQNWMRSLKTERALNIDSFSQTASVGGWQLKDAESELLDFFAAQLRLGPAPHYEVAPSLAQLDSQAASAGPLAQPVIGAVQAARQAMDRVRAELRSVRMLNALQAHTEETGQPTSSVQELKLPEEAVIDPFSGHPLIIKKADNGWLVYSVGPNGVDDGGKFENFADIGVGPAPLRWPAEKE